MIKASQFIVKIAQRRIVNISSIRKSMTMIKVWSIKFFMKISCECSLHTFSCGYTLMLKK